MERYRLQPEPEPLALPPPKQKQKHRRGPGRPFQKGYDPNKGRKPGSQNKLTVNLRKAILLAADQVGENNRGKDGLLGFLRRLAKNDTKTFAQLLAKLIPTQVTGPNGGPVQYVQLNPDILRVASQAELDLLQDLLARAQEGRPAAEPEEEDDGPSYEELLEEDSPVNGHG